MTKENKEFMKMMKIDDEELFLLIHSWTRNIPGQVKKESASKAMKRKFVELGLL